MYDDAKIRRMLLEEFPQIEPRRLEMEEIDFGDRCGAWYLPPDQTQPIRFSVDAKGRTDESIFEIMIPLMRNVLGIKPGQPDAVQEVEGEQVQTLEPKEDDFGLPPLKEAIDAIKDVTGVTAETLQSVAPRRGRHPNACTCEKCEAKRAAAV